MTETFTWSPRTDPEGTSTFRVLRAQFGDGYAQEAGDGINNETMTWPLEFVGYESEIQPIRDFLRAHQGFKHFLWTPPMSSTPGLFVVREFTLQAMGGKAFRLIATLEERFAP